MEVLILFAATFYFLPAIIASCRHHLSFGSILAVNIFVGWTLLGWFWALVWSLSGNTRRNVVLVPYAGGYQPERRSFGGILFAVVVLCAIVYSMAVLGPMR